MASFARFPNPKRLLPALAFGAAILLIVLEFQGAMPPVILLAALVGGYMAMSVGANDTANNVGPLVGGGTLGLSGGLILAAAFEALGAWVAGGGVAATVQADIIDIQRISDHGSLVPVMLSALLAGAVWLHLATFLKAPVSTTHAIVGGLLGAGIAAAGWEVAHWDQLRPIVLSWFLAPLLGGLIAAGFLYLIKRSIVYQPDPQGAAQRVAPVLMALMAWAFTAFLLVTGLHRLWQVPLWAALAAGGVVALAVFLLVRPRHARLAAPANTPKAGVDRLFRMPLIFAAALLSFAHGANDVANVAGPLSAICSALCGSPVLEQVAMPPWVILVGGLGIALGVLFYGGRLVRVVGSEITELNPSRAFCILMATATTVLLATQLGLPVSTTHIAVGAVVGVGFLREFLKTSYARMIEEIRLRHAGGDADTIARYLERFEAAPFEQKSAMLRELKEQSPEVTLAKRERKGLGAVYRQDLVKRSAVLWIATAWVVTVPLAGIIAAALYQLLAWLTPLLMG